MEIEEESLSFLNPFYSPRLIETQSLWLCLNIKEMDPKWLFLKGEIDHAMAAGLRNP